MTRLLLIVIALSLPLAAAAQDVRQDMKNAQERIFLVNEYRYDPGESTADPEIGHALCGTRCNALSSDYRNITDPGGWRLIKVGSNRELIVELNNPLISGRCVCIVDEYLVQIDDRIIPKEKNPEFQEGSTTGKQQKL